tara:strand:- start:394 stop:588 length:195 start_codon:yes stop_codon:yes gene_type:complete
MAAVALEDQALVQREPHLLALPALAAAAAVMVYPGRTLKVLVEAAVQALQLFVIRAGKEALVAP